MMSEDSIHFPDSLKFKTHRLARTVYGGGDHARLFCAD